MHSSLPLSASAAASPALPGAYALAAAAHGHALIIGDETGDLICALIRQGCPGAATLRFGERGGDKVETVLVPRVASAFEAEQAIQCAARVLLPCGEIMIHTPEGLVGEIERLLHRHGFASPRLSVGDGVILHAERPHYGPLI